MKKRISRTRHLFLTKNFILMLVMLVIIIMATSAWFTVYKTVDATHITVKAISTEIDIAESVKTYSNDYSQVLTDGPGVFGSTVEFSDITFNKDCTGDGETLIVPEFNVTKDYDSVRINGGKEVNTNLTPEYAKSSEFSRIEKLKHPDQDAPEYQFAQLEFYVRSKNPQLYLEPSSVLISKTESSNHALSEPLSAGDPKRSAYGAFNVDGIVGAMRVSLIGEACTSVNQVWSSGQLTSTDTSRGDPVKQLLWVPRPDVHLNVTETAGDISTWTMATGVTSSQYNGVTYHHSYYRPTSGGVELVANDTDPKTKVSIGTGGSVPTLGQSVNITDFSSYATQPDQIQLVVDGSDITVLDNYYVTKYKMYIWIEGTDTEARRAMDGGEFDIELDFK